MSPRIEVENNVGRGTSDASVSCTTADGRPHRMAGVEEDRYEAVGGTWRRRHMKLRVAFMVPRGLGCAGKLSPSLSGSGCVG